MKKASLILLSVLFVNIFAFSAWAAVGDTYAAMAQKYGRPLHVPLKRAVRPAEAEKLAAAGARGFKFRISDMTVYAAFNSNNVCFRMATFHNRKLPDASVFVGPLANSKPRVLSRFPRRAITLQYGGGDNAVIYRSFGLPGDYNVEAYSKALEP